jgi:hypothetical protein
MKYIQTFEGDTRSLSDRGIVTTSPQLVKDSVKRRSSVKNIDK